MPAPDDASPPSGPGDEQAGSGTHSEHEDFPWTRRIPDHPPRRNSPAYLASRKLLNKLARSITGLFYGAAPYEDHHGGGLWLKDADGWFIVRNIAGVEWSAQFAPTPPRSMSCANTPGACTTASPRQSGRLASERFG
jgi:hypothetical protein